MSLLEKNPGADIVGTFNMQRCGLWEFPVMENADLRTVYLFWKDDLGETNTPGQNSSSKAPLWIFSAKN